MIIKESRQNVLLIEVHDFFYLYMIYLNDRLFLTNLKPSNNYRIKNLRLCLLKR